MVAALFHLVEDISFLTYEQDLKLLIEVLDLGPDAVPDLLITPNEG